MMEEHLHLTHTLENLELHNFQPKTQSNQMDFNAPDNNFDFNRSYCKRYEIITNKMFIN
jgi:hypothetical protein